MFFKDQIKKLIATVIITSIVLGAAAGAIGGDIFSTFLNTKEVIKEKDDDKESMVGRTILPIDEFSEEAQTVKVVKSAMPAVVSVIATQELQRLPRSSFFDDFFFGFPFEVPSVPQEEPQVERQQVSSGSGFIVTKDGLVITNRHVVLNEKADYSVVLVSGKTYKAEVVDRDSVQDLAVVRIKKEEGESIEFPTLPLGDSQKVEIGQTVIAIGNTLGEFRNTVTRGIVSGINRTITAGGAGVGSEVIEGAIQTDAAISSGNSGGPLLNIGGEVIGVNTAVSSQGENIGFALPVDQVKLIVQSIEKHGKIVRPFLGVRYIILNEEIAKKNNMDVKEGALVTRGESREELAVIPGSPADKAGIKENDVILEVNGKKVEEGKSLQTLIAEYKIGETITLKISRAGKIMDVQVVLEERKD